MTQPSTPTLLPVHPFTPSPVHLTLTDALFARGHDFDFFQAVRLLEEVGGDRLPAVAEAVARAGAGVRVRTLAALSFPASSVHTIARPADPGSAPAVTVTFFGLTGPNGTLPLDYTDLLVRSDVPADERERLRDWFDLFNHRLAVLLYAGWEKYRFPVTFARTARLRGPDGRPGSVPDPFTRSLLGLVGLEPPGLRDRLRVDGPDKNAAPLARVDDLALLHYAGVFARRVPTAGGLGVILSDYFGVEARVAELIGQWLTLPPSARTRLADGAARTLGYDAVAGERFWDLGSKFRIVLGPLRYSEFVEFLPDETPVAARKGFFLVSQVARLYVGPEIDFEVRLWLAADECPACVLAEPTEVELGARLGWNTWLPAETPPEVGYAVTFDSRDQFDAM